MPQDGLKNKFYPLHFPPSNIKTLGSGFFFCDGLRYVLRMSSRGKEKFVHTIHVFKNKF